VKVETVLQPHNYRPNDHRDECGHDQRWDHQTAQVQDKYPEKHYTDPDQVFSRTAPGCIIHHESILPGLRVAVIKPKYDKSVICWLGRHENTDFETITKVVFLFELQRHFNCGMLEGSVKGTFEIAFEE
jgi:hypothetical protein